MKKSAKIAVVLSSAALLSGGVYYVKEREADRQLSFNKRITSMMNERDSTVSGMMITLDEIDYRLDSIRDAQGYLIIGKGSNYDGVVSKKDQIMNNITMLGNIITDNNKKITNLEALLVQLDSKNHALRKKLQDYRQRNESVNKEIENLKALLTEEREKLYNEQEKNIVLVKQVEDQNVSYAALKTQYDKVEDEAYTAYYITGSRKQLSDLNVIEQRRIPVLNLPFSNKAATYFPSGEFEKVDKREEAIIPLHTKRAVLMTPHAKDSYTLQDDEDGMKNLCITKPDVFWQSSKYLVVQTK